MAKLQRDRTLAEQTILAWCGQRGGVRKLAKEIDLLVSRERTGKRNPAVTEFIFRDGSILLSVGRGNNHKLAVVSKHGDIHSAEIIL
jgi:hypothetical protein